MKKFDKKSIIDFCKANSLEFCSNEYVGAEFTYDFKCKQGHLFKRRYGNLTQNKSCPVCKLQSRSYYNKLNLKHWAEYCNNKNITVISKEYKNARTALQFECNVCGCQFHNSPCNIKAGSGCPKCNNGTSKVEEAVRDIFESKFNKRFPTARPEFMKNPETKMNLELDGYCKELKLAFEYDGEFHYKDNPYRRGDLENRVKLDNLKDTLCKNSGVKLIRIPYTEKNNLENYIDSKINKEKK